MVGTTAGGSRGTDSPAANSKVPDRTLLSEFDKNRGSFAETEIITLLVGPEPSKKFSLHKEFACKSPVFKAAFESPFTEGQTQSYRLEENTAHATQFLIQWLYFGRVHILQRVGDADVDVDVAEEEDLALAELWVLGDKLLLPKLQNYVIRQIDLVRKKTNGVAFGTLKYIYDNTSDSSCPLRRLLVEHCAYLLGPHHYDLLSEKFPQPFLLELVKKITAIPGVEQILLAEGPNGLSRNRKMDEFMVPDLEGK